MEDINKSLNSQISCVLISIKISLECVQRCVTRIFYLISKAFSILHLNLSFFSFWFDVKDRNKEQNNIFFIEFRNSLHLFLSCNSVFFLT